MGTQVWVHGKFTVDGREWAYIRYDNADSYVWLSLLTVDETFVTPTPTPSPTPTPTITPTPTPTPTNSPTPTPSAAPTDSPAVSASPSVSPTVTADLEMYVGYGVTISQSALRNAANTSDNSIIATLPADTLLYLNGQRSLGDTVWTSAQTVPGLIRHRPDALCRRAHPDARRSAGVHRRLQRGARHPDAPRRDAHPIPAQQTGYFLTLGDDVPLRNVPGSQASISAWLAEDQAVYVSGQVYYEGYTWHVSNYNNCPGLYPRTTSSAP